VEKSRGKKSRERMETTENMKKKERKKQRDSNAGKEVFWL